MKTLSLGARGLVVVTAATFAGMACSSNPVPDLSPGAANLVSGLSGSTGLSQADATAGAGAVLGVAQQNLSSAEWNSVAGSLPGSSDLMSAASGAFDPTKAAPQLSEAAMAAQGAGVSIPGLGNIGNANEIISAFDQLGIDPAMVSQVVPSVLDFAGTTGGSGTAALLQKGLGIM